jgi:formylglycine-generating enzyme required for sulfatase activity
MKDADVKHPAPERLRALQRGRLDAAEAAAVRAHLMGCPTCQGRLETVNLPSASSPGRGNVHETPTVGLGAAAPASSAPVPAALADHPRYRVLELLGQGGMGSVYKAEHRMMERAVALKVVNPELVGDRALVQRFEQEVKAAARLAHPHIVAAHDADTAGDLHFLVMEYVDGVSLAEVIAQRGPLPVSQACECVRQAALGLQHAFEKGMVHRDIKPANLMLNRDGCIKILDFGLARLASERGGPLVTATPPQTPAGLTSAGTIMGTPDFLAPEQAQDARRADIRADIYSLGCTLYDLLTGRPPFPEGSLLQKLLAHCERSPTPVRSLRADVPPELAVVLGRMMAKDPTQRYETPAEVAKALGPFARGGAPAMPPGARRAKTIVRAATPPGAGPPTRPVRHESRPTRARRRPLVLAGAGAVLVALLGMAALALWLGSARRTRNTQTADTVPPPSSDPVRQSVPAPSASVPPTRPSAPEKKANPGKEVDRRPVSEKQKVLPAQPVYKNHLGMEFAFVPRGRSWLGGGRGKTGTRELNVPYDFYLGVYEVTHGEWEKITGVNPSRFSRRNEARDAVQVIPDEELKRFPVETVSWEDAQAFVRRLNERERERGWVYRLPTQDEWEYACRGGPMTDPLASAADFYVDGPTQDLASKQANFKGSEPGGRAEEGPTVGRPTKVGSYACPNRLGLYDMHGNVWEWCQEACVHRGGGWDDGGVLCRAAVIHPSDSSFKNDRLGLRVARVPSEKEPELPPPPPVLKTGSFKNRLGMEFVLVPAGRAWLGGGQGRPGDRQVDVPYDFYLGKYEVTQEEWSKTGRNPSHYQGRVVATVPRNERMRFPVEMVSWQQAQEFVKWVNDRDKEVGWEYRLPTEVEWEYACRGGPMRDRFDGAFDFYLARPSTDLSGEQANFNGTLPAGAAPSGRFLRRTCKVGSYAPNRLGLYDMHGNVFEWCQDSWDGGGNRAVRGGCVVDNGLTCSAAYRRNYGPTARDIHIGLRLARVLAGRK